MEESSIFIGVDVSKARLDVAIRPSGENESVANDKTGIKALVKHLGEIQPALIVLEATGGVERQLTRALASAELPVVVVNPRQVRDFAKATGQLAKTDAIDAVVLARFAETVRPVLRPLPDEVTLELRALIARRRQITEMMVAERNRLRGASQSVTKRIDGSHPLAGSRTATSRQRSGPEHPSKPDLARERRLAEECPQYRSCD